MHSELIFQAQERIANRYALCHAVAKVTRCLHFSSSNTHDAIGDALLRVARVECMAEMREASIAGEDGASAVYFAGDRA